MIHFRTQSQWNCGYPCATVSLERKCKARAAFCIGANMSLFAPMQKEGQHRRPTQLPCAASGAKRKVAHFFRAAIDFHDWLRRTFFAAASVNPYFLAEEADNISSIARNFPICPCTEIHGKQFEAWVPHGSGCCSSYRHTVRSITRWVFSYGYKVDTLQEK